ncbi:MAG: GNAT family N-acetyltransferase [Parcubacteria group bacterium]|nr:GNAT family N-acetyltransferase [Parcubacteria group bacterium]
MKEIGKVENKAKNLEMPMDIDGVVCLTAKTIYDSDIRELAKLSAEAYEDPPSMLLAFLTDGEMGDILVAYQEMLLRAILDEGGIIYAIRDEEEKEYIASAWWFPVGKELTIEVMGPYLWQFLKDFGLKKLYLMMVATRAVTKTLKKVKKYFGRLPHVHLMNLVVQRDYRRKGYAHKLLDPIIGWSKSERVILYVEAAGWDNVHYVYPSFKFEPMGKIKIENIPYECMMRFP